MDCNTLKTQFTTLNSKITKLLTLRTDDKTSANELIRRRDAIQELIDQIESEFPTVEFRGEKMYRSEFEALREIVEQMNIAIDKSNILDADWIKEHPEDLREMIKIQNLDQIEIEDGKIVGLSITCPDMFEKIPESLGQLVYLRKLFLDISDFDDLNVLENLKELQVLGMPNSSLPDLSPLSKLPKLTKLICFQSSIDDVNKESIKKLTNLEELNFSTETFSKLDYFENLNKLKKLFILLDDEPIDPLTYNEQFYALKNRLEVFEY